MTTPKVITREIDKSIEVQSVTNNTTGYVGLFEWGPADAITGITTNEQELAQVFGKPTVDTSLYFHACANYMLYSVPMKIVRVVGSGALNAMDADAIAATESPILVKNADEFDDVSTTQFTTAPAFIGKYPGELVNGATISVADNTDYQNWSYAGEFDFEPVAGEVNVVVVDTTGDISGTAGTILERYEQMTNTVGAKKPDGTVAYLKQALKEQSQYVYLVDFGAIDLTSGVYEVDMSGGVNDNDPANADFTAGIDKFSNKEAVSIFRFMTSGLDSTAQAYAVDLAVSRGDFITLTHPELTDVYNQPTESAAADNVIEYFNTTLNKPESYNFQIDNWKLVSDTYNGTELWIPCDSDVAGLHARLPEMWFSPAGLERGRIKNAIKLAWNPSEVVRDRLYKSSINSMIDIEGQGKVLWGDRTALKAKSAFRQIGVRSLFIILRKNISTFAKNRLFDFNDPITWALFRNPTDQYLENVKSRRGIIQKKVVADETNNTAGSDEFTGDIYIKPNKSIQLIRLNFVAVGASVSFEEVEGQF